MIPTQGAAALTAAAARRSIFARRHLATPDCPTCDGNGWHMRRVEFGMAGVEAVACHCTEGVMAKRPQTAHGKALAAFTNGLITRAEYQRCCIGRACVSGRTIFMAVRMFWRDGWTLRMRRFGSKSMEGR